MTNEYIQQLRVFLSSTFSDMQKERDALVKLFRQLSNEGKRRGIDIKLVDLRWGVTDDQKRTGRVISTCLQEIDNSRPFFIGLVGDRYGWIPSMAELTINPELSEKFPVIDNYFKQGISITEIEMRYGALDSESKDNSFFLIKSNSKIENDRHRHLWEEITSENVNHDFYQSVDDLTAKTREVMIDLLNRNFPILENIPEWQQYENIHNNIAKTYSTGYIHYGDYIDKLNQWLKSKSQYLVVAGEAGSGKSSLISEWLMNDDFGEYKVAYHFIGNGLAEGSHLDIQRHFLTLLENEYGLEQTPAKPINSEDDYIMELEKALTEAERRGDKWLLIVDGLDHLPDNAMTKLMMWFPELPSTAKALFTTISTDMTYKRLCEALGYEELTVAPLQKDFIEKIVIDYLANVGKSIDADLTDLIASNPLFSNPYQLRLLLDELVTYGVHEKIREIVSDFTGSKDKSDFYGKLISHAEEYYGQKRVKDILLLIVSTKDGLSENAITEILNLDPIDWAMTYAGLQRMLVFVNGKYRIASQDLKEAINEYYEIEKSEYEDLIEYALQILNYLEKEENEIEEMAYLYFCTGNLEKLHSLLINPNYIIRLVLADKLFAIYWNALMEETDHTLDEYLDVEFKNLPDWDADEQIFFLSDIISVQFSNSDLSCKLTEKSNQLLLSKDKDNKDNQGMVAANYVVMAQYQMDMGKNQEAAEMLRKAEDLYLGLDEQLDSNLVFTKANLEYGVGRYNEALDLYLKAIELAKAEDADIPWKYYNNAGLAYLQLYQLDDANKMFAKAIDEIKKNLIENTIEAATVFQNRGLTYYHQGKYDKAEDLYNRALEILQLNIENPDSRVALVLNNLGIIYRDREEFDEALDYFMEAADILISIGDVTPHHGLIYQNIGIVWEYKKDIEKASEWILKSIDAFWDTVSLEHPGFQESCYMLMNIYEELGEFEQALGFIEKLLIRAEEELGEVNDFAGYCHLHLGHINLYMDLKDDAQIEFQISHDIFSQLGDNDGLELTEEAFSELQG